MELDKNIAFSKIFSVVVDILSIAYSYHLLQMVYSAFPYGPMENQTKNYQIFTLTEFGIVNMQPFIVFGFSVAQSFIIYD